MAILCVLSRSCFSPVCEWFGVRFVCQMSHGVAFPLAFLGPFLGPFIIFMGHFAYLLPFYFTLNALILGNRQEAEWIMRSALLKSMVISGLRSTS